MISLVHVIVERSSIKGLLRLSSTSQECWPLGKKEKARSPSHFILTRAMSELDCEKSSRDRGRTMELWTVVSCRI